MAVIKFESRVRQKRDTAANWTSYDPILLDGEIIIVDTSSGEIRFKIGDGEKKYSQLPFQDEILRNTIGQKQDSGGYARYDVAQDLTDEQKTLARNNIGANFSIDSTLSNTGQAADAKAVGDVINNIQFYLLNIDYDAILAFNTNEIVVDTTMTTTSSVLGQAILGQMVLA